MDQQSRQTAGPQSCMANDRIDLRILSPGQGVPETIEIQNVPVNTQISQLKERIQMTSPTNPAVDAQRLIYKGHVLANPAATLRDVFGADDLREHRSFTLHLVIRNAEASHAQAQSRSRTSTPLPAAHNFAQQQTRAFTPANQPANQMPAAAPFGQLPGVMLPGFPGMPQIPGFPPGLTPMPQFPGQFQLPQHFQAPGQPQMPQAPQVSGTSSVPSDIGQDRGSSAQPSQGASSVGVSDGRQAPEQTQDASAQPQAQQTPQNDDNRLRYQVTFNQTVQVPNHPGAQLPPGFPSQFMPAQNFNGQQFGNMGRFRPTANMHQRFPSQLPNLDGAQSTASASGTNASQNIQPGAQVLAPSSQTQTQSTSSSTPTTVYLLSSPQGPHAILYNSQGMFNFGSPRSMPFIRPGVRTSTPRQAPAPDTGRRAPEAEQQRELINQVVRAAQQADAAPARAGGAAAPQNADAEADILGPIQPLLSHLWLLFRILLFAYFFVGSGMGWTRPAVLGGICAAFFLLRGADAGAGVRDRVRGWWEDVVGLPPRQRPGEQQQGAQGQAGVQGQVQGLNVQPTPTQPQQGPAQAQNDELGPWRARLRPLERALALFIASIWPGVGERTVRARREEEERQQRERNEAEVRARQIEQEQQQSQQALQEGAADGASAAGSVGTTERVAGSDGKSQESESTPVSTAQHGEASASGVEPAGDGSDVRERRRVAEGSES